MQISSFTSRVRGGFPPPQAPAAARGFSPLPRAATRPGQAPAAPRATANDSGLPSDAEVIPLAALPPASSAYAGLRLLVVGGSGGTGAAVCAAAAAEGIPVTALARDPAAARAVLPMSVGVVKGDVTRYASLLAAFQAAGDFNAVVWAAGSNSLSSFRKGAQAGGPAGLARALATAANPLAARAVELAGVENALAALRETGRAGEVGRFVLVSSIGADDPLAQAVFPGGVLFWKKRAEEVVQRAGVPYTIIRPGGLKNSGTGAPSLGSAGLVMTGPDGIGFGKGRARPGAIPRAQVAEVCLAALVTAEAAGKVVEVVSEKNEGGAATRTPWADLFGAATQ